MLVNDYIFSTKVLVNDVIDFGKTSENFNGSELDRAPISTMKQLLLTCALLLLFNASILAQETDSFSELTQPFLQKHCIACHDLDSQEGGVSLDGLTAVTADNAELWKRVWEQVALKEMPPREESDQPSAMERWKLAGWITSELQSAMKDRGGFETHLHPEKGNHLDHDLLFGKTPSGLQPTSTPARIWRIHPQEHLVRLNALINREPKFNPSKPGLRAAGDHIQPNQDGEVKIYYGLDRVIGWVGGTAAYAAAITGFSPVLTTNGHHGLRNYPIQYSVNGAEATQIANHAEDILRFMAYGPKAESYQFAKKVSEIDQKYKHGDLRGLAQSLFYSEQIKRPLTPVYELMKDSTIEGPELKSKLKAAVNYIFEALTCRPPSDQESTEYVNVAMKAIDDLGLEEGAFLGLAPIFLDREALFRLELAEQGQPDKYGRVRLQGMELALAINGAFSYLPPDDALRSAAISGDLESDANVKDHLDRILNDDRIRKPRMLQFFREYFDYDRAGHICKDARALIDAGGDVRTYYRTMFRYTANTDRLIELILAEDKNVLGELLTTNRVVLNGNDHEEVRHFSEFEKLIDVPSRTQAERKKKYTLEERGMMVPPKGDKIHVRIARVVKNGRTQKSLTTLPSDQRMGILTHPSWLVSHSDAMDNHAILRGRWIRERLLGDAVPDVPITVDAMLPVEPKSTLRHRMRVTREDECWRCHRKMDPLGLPFESYNHLGLFRTKEKEKPVDTSGEIIDSGEAGLDGPVADAQEMIKKLANSKRVKQVFVRHAFRFWIGRNETLNDAPVLQDAFQAYEENGGSMKALVASLLTSDAFLYRCVNRDSRTEGKPSD
jgi:hypothetical protein